MLTAAMLLAAQSVAPFTPVPGFPKTGAIENSLFAPSVSTCIILASGRFAIGISAEEREDPFARYLRETPPADLASALPPSYRGAEAYRVNAKSPLGNEPGAGQPPLNGVWVFWQSDTRQCAVVARLHDPAGGMDGARDVARRHGFQERHGVLSLELAPNPAVGAPSSKLAIVAEDGNDNRPSIILVENRES